MVAAMVSDTLWLPLQLWLPPTSTYTFYSYGYPLWVWLPLHLWLQLWLPPTALSVSYEKALDMSLLHATVIIRKPSSQSSPQIRRELSTRYLS